MYLWKLPGVQRLTRRPRIDGLWEVTLKPTDESHIPPEGNRGPLRAYLVVSQSFWTAHVRQVTAESSSRSRAFFWERDGVADVDTLAFVYANEPRSGVEHRSRMHLGTCRIDVVNLKPTDMSGVYFTDRYTKGDMELRLIDRSRGHATFQAAEKHAAASLASSRSDR
ncbi:Cap15 family cyclic dinucleotide receptor domain-containing protein [Jiangella alkaliphila]